MTQISRDEVIHLAELSKLQLTEEEIESLSVDIGNILAYVDQLNELDTSEVEPTYQVIDLKNIWRDDVAAEPTVRREALLTLAPASADNQVKVPKVL
jgi:aspartyl-tRNA(Asn)/glutamyl-tRNA(Gln) amidotransferase subunit C